MKFTKGEFALVIFLFIAGGILAFAIGWVVNNLFPLSEVSKLIGG